MHALRVTAFTLLGVLAYTLVIATSSIADTRNVQLATGDELYAGHDLVHVRYTNRPGRIVASAWVTDLRHRQQFGVHVRTKGAPEDNYYITVRQVKGEPRATAQAIDPVYLTPTGPTLCSPQVAWNDKADRVTVRAEDACFQGADLSRVAIGTDLGLRGKNNLSDFSGYCRVVRGRTDT